MATSARQRAGGTEIPVLDRKLIPWLLVEQMREVDRLMIEEFQISLVRMMENAGSCLAELARALLGGGAHGERIVVLAGSGGNGGGGLVAARHLINAGAEVEVRLSAPRDQITPVPAEQLSILERMGVRCGIELPTLDDPALVLDAILGYSQHGQPFGAAAKLIEWTAGRRVLALDTPSGLELSTGTVHSPHVAAEATMTLALPKQALRAADARASVGDVYLADISVPAHLYAQMGLSYRSPFGEGRIVRLGMASTDLDPSPRADEATSE